MMSAIKTSPFSQLVRAINHILETVCLPVSDLSVAGSVHAKLGCSSKTSFNTAELILLKQHY